MVLLSKSLFDQSEKAQLELAREIICNLVAATPLDNPSIPQDLRQVVKLQMLTHLQHTLEALKILQKTDQQQPLEAEKITKALLLDSQELKVENESHQNLLEVAQVQNRLIEIRQTAHKDHEGHQIRENELLIKVTAYEKELKTLQTKHKQLGQKYQESIISISKMNDALVNICEKYELAPEDEQKAQFALALPLGNEKYQQYRTRLAKKTLFIWSRLKPAEQAMQAIAVCQEVSELLERRVPNQANRSVRNISSP